ncbi:hypothetical protein BGP_3803 [Beggiatoa sp. PS]|nr:hypothetical protein BGP_3803 [Beggiatoa sp. PS]
MGHQKNNSNTHSFLKTHIIPCVDLWTIIFFECPKTGVIIKVQG